MSKEEKLKYLELVEDEVEYHIKVRIGEANDGSHTVYGTCSYDTEPEDDNPEWKSHLGLGKDIKDKYLKITSGTQKTNPNSESVSVRIFLNDKLILPKEGSNEIEAEDNEIVYFKQKVKFK